MVKKPLFISNSKDNMHCVNAVFRMVHKYYFGKDLTWKQIDKITKAIPGKATWTFVGEMEFAKKGLIVENIEPVDYLNLYREGPDYLKKIVGENTYRYYIEKSNIANVLHLIPQYLKTVHHETRRATVQEITGLLKKGFLIGAEINSRILNKREGFSLHFVLLYNFDGTNFVLHDPGNPSIKSRRVDLEEFDRCFNFPGANGGITIFKGRRGDNR